MNKSKFLETLDKLLSSLPYHERREIMYDYEEHFKEAEKDGILEDDIIRALGSPEKIAKEYLPSLPVIINNKEHPIPPKNITKKGNGTGEIVILTTLTLLLNAIFILGPYLGLWGVIIGFIITGFALIFAGFVLLISALFAVPLSVIHVPIIFLQHPILMICLSIALICIGGLILIGFYYMTKLTCKLTYKYVKWLIRVIRGY